MMCAADGAEYQYDGFLRHSIMSVIRI